MAHIIEMVIAEETTELIDWIASIETVIQLEEEV